jgi:DNA repair exonuclease SbcCD ATPase subunit
MFREINERLAMLKGRQRQKANGEKRVQDLTDELARMTHERDQWAERLRKEQKDVDRLKGISFGALFYSMIGRKAEKLSEEEAELLQVKLKYDEAAATVNDLEAELTELKRELADLRFIDAEIEAALEEKRKLIQETSPSLAAELQLLTDQEAEEQANLKELQEAASAGRSVISALDRARERLESARNWGTYDMLGGGLIATAVKHSRIDDARSAIHAAQNRLRRFRTELQDVQRDVNVEIEIGGMLTFADYFFDGLITDWIVQGRIHQSLNQINEKRSQIGRIVAELEALCRRTESKLRELQRRRIALIESA